MGHINRTFYSMEWNFLISSSNICDQFFFFHFELKQLWKWKNERVNGLELIYSILDDTKLTKVI